MEEQANKCTILDYGSAEKKYEYLPKVILCEIAEWQNLHRANLVIHLCIKATLMYRHHNSYLSERLYMCLIMVLQARGFSSI
jgi:hypothetical protein